MGRGMNDKEREDEIDRLCWLLRLAKGKEEQAYFNARMNLEIKRRSPEQVARMEREAGLCHGR